MESEGTTYLIYDKESENIHSFNNLLTIEYSVESIFKLDNIKIKDGDDAIDYINKKSISDTYKINEKLDKNIYKISVIEFSKNNINIMITLLCVNNKNLENYFYKFKTIPSKEFLMLCCRYHLNYLKNTEDYLIKLNNVKTKKTPYQECKDNVLNIVSKVIQPNNNLFEDKIKDYEYLKKDLYTYQKKTINWLQNIEKKEYTYFVNENNYDSEINIGNIFYDPLNKQFKSNSDKLQLRFTGGALIDEVGLGKTIECIMLSLLNKKQLNENDNHLDSKATLIICPNQLCGQWSREFGNFLNLKNIKITLVLTKVHFDKYSYSDLINSDFVIVSFNFLDNPVFVNELLGDNYNKKYFSSYNYDYHSVNHIISEKIKFFNKEENILELGNKKALLPLIKWHRIIIDEFHEITSVSKYSYMINLINHFRSNYKWCITGTPFNSDSFNTMIKMINFTTNTKTKEYAYFLNSSINYHMNNLFFRRNTKKSIEDEMKLLPLKEKLIWLNFSKTERMIYQANLANPNINKFDKFTRQLCCHPNLAEETRNILSNCKTLDDIEKMMILHYKNEYEVQELRVKKVLLSIKKLELKIKHINFKRQRKFLKKKGYKVVIEYPNRIEIDKLQNEINNNKKKINIQNEEYEIDENDYDDDSDSDDENNNKPLMIVNDENQDKILLIIDKLIENDKNNTIEELNQILNNYNNKLNIETTNLNGKRSTYEFFSNVVDKIKKTGEKEYDSDSDSDSDDEENCGICLDSINNYDVGVTVCGHIFHYECLKQQFNINKKCPMCNKQLTESDIYLVSYEKKQKNPNEVIKDKISLINKVGTKLGNLIFYLLSIDEHVIIFSQWDNLLKEVGLVLNEYGIKNVFCRGNVWQRDMAIRRFYSDDDIKVIMLSSESAASGTNLTKASKVILLDPVYGSYEHRKNTEWQAVGRAYRLGQTKEVEVVRFIIKNSVEEEIYIENKKNDSKINENMIINETTEDSINLSTEKIIKLKKNIKVKDNETINKESIKN